MHRSLLVGLAATSLAIGSLSAFATEEAARRWIDSEFQPSVLSKEQQMEEMRWFIKAAAPFKGMEINIVAEGIPTHEYEARTLAKAFEEIAGIKVNMQIMGEGDVVQALQTQLQTGRNLYDGFVNDSDLIGMHSRLGLTINLTDYMAGEGKDVTLPTLDVKDFVGISFTTGPDGKVWQLPDQQFANLYWFRKDWFDRADLKKRFKDKFGYDLGVPVNWSAYEDIAEFFTNDVKEIDGVRVYGHMDYGKRGPDLGWRMTDAWLSMAGTADLGIPNGRPVDEWGIRMEKGSCNPSGASVARGGAVNSPAAVYAVTKWNEWLRKYAPPGAADLDFYQSLPALSSGQRRPAGVLVHGLHRRDGEAEERRQQHRQRQRRCAMAHGPLADRLVLEGRHAARLSGRRIVDAPQVHAGGSPQGCLAVRAVRRLQDGGPQEEPRRPDVRA